MRWWERKTGWYQSEFELFRNFGAYRAVNEQAARMDRSCREYYLTGRYEYLARLWPPSLCSVYQAVCYRPTQPAPAGVSALFSSFLFFTFVDECSAIVVPFPTHVSAPCKATVYKIRSTASLLRLCQQTCRSTRTSLSFGRY